MNKNLQVSFKIGNRQEVWIQHPDLSASIHADDYNATMSIAAELASHLNIEFEYFDLDEIYDGQKAYEVELWDYNDSPTLVKSVNLKNLEIA